MGMRRNAHLTGSKQRGLTQHSVELNLHSKAILILIRTAVDFLNMTRKSANVDKTLG